MPELAGIFRQPFPEQVAAFRARLGDLVATSRWDDIRHSAHDRAFMVAGATKADLLADLAAAVDKAISEGTSLEEFRADFRKLVEKNGWHGWTGEGTKKGEAWRTRVIYRTNCATSYAAGRTAQLVEGNFAFWIYRHGASVEPRLHHLAWDRVALPPDHPFWRTHSPLNGWGCTCYIVGARTERGIARVGGDPNKTLPQGWQKIDPKTGAPVGIGKGWAYSPGASAVDTVLALRDKLDKLPERPSIDLIQDWLKSGSFADWMNAPKGNWPLVRIASEDAKAIQAQRTVADLSAQTMAKQLREHPELTPADYAAAQRTVSGATHRIKDGPRSMVFVRNSDDGHLLVVKATQSGQGLFVSSLRRMSKKAAMRDTLLRRLLKKG